MTELPEVQTCRLADGKKIAWREWGSGSPLILLHGWSMSSVVFAEVAPRLANSYRVLCPDLPGHGHSDPFAGDRLSQLAATVAQWADLLALQEVDLLGWSLGGQIALQLAINKQLALKKLLLVATTPRFCQADDWKHGLPTTQVKALARNLGRCYEKTLGDFFKLQFVGESLTKERYRQIIAFAVRTGCLPDPEQSKLLLNLLASVDLRSELAAIDVPVHLLHGQLDTIIPPAAGEYLAQNLADAVIDRMPEIGHSPFFSRPQESVELWQKYLK